MEHHERTNGQKATFATFRSRLTVSPPDDIDGAEEMPASPLFDMVDRLTDRFDQLEFTVLELAGAEEGRGITRPAIAERLAGIEERLESQAATMVEPDLAPFIDTLTSVEERAEAMQAQLDEMATRLAGMDGVAARLARIEVIEARLADLAAAQPDSAALAAFAERAATVTAEKFRAGDAFGEVFARLGQLDMLAERMDELAGLAPQLSMLDTLPDLIETVRTLSERVETVESLARAAAEAPATSIPARDSDTWDRIRAAWPVVNDRLDTILTAFDQTSRNFAATSHVLLGHAEGSPSDPAGAAPGELLDSVADLSKQLATAEKRLGSAIRRKPNPQPLLEEIRSEVAALSERLGRGATLAEPREAAETDNAAPKGANTPRADTVGKTAKSPGTKGCRPPALDLTALTANGVEGVPV